MGIILRKAKATDCDLLFKWVNDPEVRAASFRSAAIAYDEHCRWYANKLTEPDSHIFIGVSSNGGFVGMVRLDNKETGRYVSILVAKEYRGYGYGTQLLEALDKECLNLLERDDCIIAEIKKDNKGSIAIFEKAGYLLVDEGVDRFVYKKNIDKVSNDVA